MNGQLISPIDIYIDDQYMKNFQKDDGIGLFQISMGKKKKKEMLDRLSFNLCTNLDQISHTV